MNKSRVSYVLVNTTSKTFAIIAIGREKNGVGRNCRFYRRKAHELPERLARACAIEGWHVTPYKYGGLGWEAKRGLWLKIK